MNSSRILVAGLGNIFPGDDAFGAETIRTLQGELVPDGVTVKDFGIRSCDLTYAMLEGYDAVILVDATPRGQSPGTLSLVALDPPAPPEEEGTGARGGRLHPDAVLRLAAAFGAPIRSFYLVGCEPAILASTSRESGLSPPVQAAIPGAIAIIRSLLGQLLSATPVNLGAFAGMAPKSLGPTRTGSRGEGTPPKSLRSLMTGLLSGPGRPGLC